MYTNRVDMTATSFLRAKHSDFVPAGFTKPFKSTDPTCGTSRTYRKDSGATTGEGDKLFSARLNSALSLLMSRYNSSLLFRTAKAGAPERNRDAKEEGESWV